MTSRFCSRCTDGIINRKLLIWLERQCESSFTTGSAFLFPDTALVGSQVLLAHASRSETLEKPLVARLAIETWNALQCFYGLFDTFNNESGDAFVDDFGDGAAAKGDDW